MMIGRRRAATTGHNFVLTLPHFTAYHDTVLFYDIFHVAKEPICRFNNSRWHKDINFIAK